MARSKFKSATPPVTPPWTIPGTVYRLAGPSGPGLAVDTIVDPEIDTAKMTAAAIICTPTVDRQNEIIQPDGVDFADYTKNPVVLWEHGFNPNMPLPIARCETDDGKLDLRASPEAIEATSHFSTKSMESYQIFGLIVDRIVRATSIHILPDETVERIIGSERVTVYPRSRMLEFSWGCIGVNPEAVARVLNTGRIGGDAICESIAKTLRPFAPLPSRSRVRPGFDNGAGNGKAKTMTPEEQAAADAKAKADAAAAAAAAGITSPDPDEPAEPDGNGVDTGDQKPTPRLLSAIQSSLASLQANVEAGLTGIENPDAIEFLNGDFKTQLSDLSTSVQDCYAATGGTAKTDDAADSEPPDDDAMKTFLAGGVRNRLKVLSIAAPLELLTTAKNLTPEQKLTITTAIDGLRKTVKAAKVDADAAKAKVADAEVAKTTEQLASVAKTLNDVQTQLKELSPVGA